MSILSSSAPAISRPGLIGDSNESPFLVSHYGGGGADSEQASARPKCFQSAGTWTRQGVVALIAVFALLIAVVGNPTITHAQQNSQPSAAAPATPADDWKPMTVNGMQMSVLLPANYSKHRKYPVILYLHQLDMGDWPVGLMQEIDPWFESPAWRAAYPAIVICPFLDQNADKSGKTINFGGVSPDDQPGQDNAIAAVKAVMKQYSTDPSRIYVTGNSMGGIGSWDIIIKYNAIDGTQGRIFAAAMPLAGATYDHGYPVPDPAVVDELKSVPIRAIHGANDNQVPTVWDRAMATALARSSTFTLILDPNLAHDVWDTYYPLPNGKANWDWLFAQRAPKS